MRKSNRHFNISEEVNLPVVEAPGLWARVIAGSAFGQTSPVGMFSDWFYAEVMLEAGTSAPLDRDYEERAIYIVLGEIEIAGETFEAPRLLIFRPGDRITVRASSRSRLMFLGGSALEGPRYIWWNFVSSRRERIEQAKEDWKSGRNLHPFRAKQSLSPSRRELMAQDATTKPTAERYLEDFVAGQTFSSGRARESLRRKFRASRRNSILSPFISANRLRSRASFGDWRQAVGTLPPSPCDFWWRATLSLQAE